MGSINILYIVQSGKLGGAEISMLQLLKHINRDIYNPIVLGPSCSDLSLQLKTLNIELVNFSLPRIKSHNPVRIIFNIFTLIINCLAIGKIIKQKNINIVHTISNKRSAIFGIIAARITNTPVVWTIMLLEWNGVIDKFLMANSDRLIVVSNRVEKMFNRNARNKDKFCRIHLALDLSEFDLSLNMKRPLLKKWSLKRTDFIVAMVCRLTSEKGVEYFIEAASKISKNESEIKFLIIGEQSFDGTNDYYKSLVNFCDSIGVKDKIKFVNFESDIIAIMATIDLLVLYSKAESFGRVLIEAMAMEKPVIANKCGGPEEIVEHNKTGILLATRNASDLADSIFYLCKNPEIAKKMGKEGRKRVEKYFTIEQHVRDHEKVYDEIVISSLRRF